MQIIAIANQKGGCGKTTTAINLAASLADLNQNVLLIDMDAQAHATLGLNVNPENLEKSMYNVLTDNEQSRMRLDQVITRITEKLDLAPANIRLCAIEQELSGKPAREAKLHQAISLMVGTKTYDFVIIDCSPSLGLLTFNALRASNEVIAPVETGFFSLHGISKLMETINLINSRLDCKIKVKALLTMFNRRTRFAQEIKEQIFKYFSGNVFNTIIRNNIRLREASSHGVPITSYDQRSNGAEDYIQLAREVSSIKNTAKNKQDDIFIKRVLDKARAQEPQIQQKQDIDKIIPEKKLEKETKFFVYAPEAKSVEIAGDFNNWVAQNQSKLENEEKGVWSRVYKLNPGKYQYKFIVDGKWIVDPNNPKRVSDPVGNENSLVEIE
ncbi:MAG: AAA family ATPase [Candidatus Omnitrophota bacterium]